MKTTKRTVIDVKEGIVNSFKIGHSKANSETMIPTIVPGPEKGPNEGQFVHYIDLAGFYDTRSGFIDIMN